MRRVSLLNELQQNPFVLAPMAGITDNPFRSFMREMGSGIVITELVSATGLVHNSEKTRRLMGFAEDQHPVGVQLFGDNLNHLAFACYEVEKAGADFIDLNFGCPVSKVVKKGAGAALLKDLSMAQKVFQTARGATQLPITVKIRTGWDDSSRNATELSHIAFEEGLSWVAIHGRTRAQGYSGLADWDYIAEVKSRSKIPILGNGDLTSASLAVERLQESGCDGVMIGRGCLKNPWIFAQALGLLKGESESTKKDFSYMFQRLLHYLESRCAEPLISLQLKKLAAWFSAGYPNSSAFRKKIFQLKDPDEVRFQVGAFFARMDLVPQEDTSHQPFLMGGHG
jgi:nifR3 family TIM-barrel protein